MFESMSRLRKAVSRSICAENFTGEKGKGGMAEVGSASSCARDLGRGWKVNPWVPAEAGQTITLCDIKAEGVIRHIWITDCGTENRKLILRMYWDGAETPSVEVPMGDFFASANYQQYAPIASTVVCVNPYKALNCYWEMPFHKEAKITLENLSSKMIPVFYQIDYTEEEVAADAGYFHAQFRRTNPVKYKDVYTILDGVKAKGMYMGTYLYWGQNNNGWWGEGEIKFYLDGDGAFPTICGTGTEDYFCGSHNFDVGGKYTCFTSPYSGLSKLDETDSTYKCCQRFNMYRWHLPDPIFFEKDIRVTIQDLGWRDEGRYLARQDDISSVAYWYADRVCSFPKFPDKDEIEII